MEFSAIYESTLIQMQPNICFCYTNCCSISFIPSLNSQEKIVKRETLKNIVEKQNVNN